MASEEFWRRLVARSPSHGAALPLQYEANLWGKGGDSGSPVFYGTKAHGISVGNNCDGCSQLYYTPIKRVEEFWSNAFMVLTYQP